jgi:hypothetical protein
MLNIAFPLFFNVHCTMNSASVVRTSSARAALTFASYTSSRRAVDSNAWLVPRVPSGGLVSNSFRSSTIDVHCGRVAMCMASFPSDIDFTCGCQAGLSAGTRSSSVRVVAVS